MNQARKGKTKLTKLIILSLMGTISFLLFFLNFPLPFLPPYLKIDFSDVPAIIAAFIFSPLAGVIVIAIKNGLYFAVSGASDPIGVLANLIAGIMFTVPIAMLYHKYKNVKSVVSGLITGTIVMAIGMSVLNYFVILPAYAWFMGWDMGGEAKWLTVIAGVLPFNILKGLIVGILFVPMYIKLKTWIADKRTNLV